MIAALAVLAAELKSLGGGVCEALRGVERSALVRGASVFLASEVRYSAVFDHDGGLLFIELPDGSRLEAAERELKARLNGPGRDLVASLGLRAPSDAAADRLGRDLAIFALAAERLAVKECGLSPVCLKRAARELRCEGEVQIPMMDDQALAAAAARVKSLEFVRLHRRSDGAAPPPERLWRKAGERMGPHDAWIGAAAMAEAISEAYPHRREGGAVVFYPKGKAPKRISKPGDEAAAWARIEAGLIQGLPPLSPEAAEELAELLSVMDDGEFLPVPPEEPAPKRFVEIPPERSGLALPAPEAPLHDWEGPGDMPGGFAILDYDRDGLPDLFFCDFDQARLYRNLGGLRFEDVTAAAGLSGVNCANGASSADFDNDGWPDLLTLHDKEGRDHLYRNDHGRFVDVTASVGLSTAPAFTTSAVWLDYDRDGRLDLYLVEAFDYHRIMQPAGLPMRGLPNRLYHNLGDRFEETAARAGVADAGVGLAAASFDYDGDGWPDLDVQNDFGRNILFRNRGDGTFADATEQSGAGAYGNGMGISVADVFLEGRMDLLLTYIGKQRSAARFLFADARRSPPVTYFDTLADDDAREGYVLRYRQANRLLRNTGGGRFVDAGSDAAAGWGWSGFFFDSQNAGRQDLYQVNGWWPWRLGYADETKVYKTFDAARGRYVDASAESGLDFAGDSRAAGYADFDRDGCLDVVATGFHRPRLFAGRCPAGSHWLSLKLSGTRSNRDGIGARVTVRAGPLVQTAQMGPQGGGFQTSLLRELHFGLGGNRRADSVEIEWPSGVRQRLGSVEGDRVLEVNEGAGD